LRFDGKRYLLQLSPGGKAAVVSVLDLAGLSAAAMSDFSAMQRLQQRLTNWQESGRWRGLDASITLNVPQAVRLRWQDGELHLEGQRGSWEVVVDPVAGGAPWAGAGAAGARRQAHLPRLGGRHGAGLLLRRSRQDRLARGSGLRSRRSRPQLSGAKLTAVDIKDEMALRLLAAHASGRIVGWPPPPLPPILGGAMKGEGQWVEVRGPSCAPRRDGRATSP